MTWCALTSLKQVKVGSETIVIWERIEALKLVSTLVNIVNLVKLGRIVILPMKTRVKVKRRKCNLKSEE